MTSSEPTQQGGPVQPQVEVRRSGRRRRTVQAYLRDGTVVVLLPARMTKAEERFWVAEMVGRLQRQDQRRERSRNRSDADLLVRARSLAAKYLDGRARPAEVRWVTNQNDRWGSCTPAHRSIRLSARLRDLPRWVSDYVLVHELAHLLEPGHGPDFWRLVERYPRTERARGYLEGLLAGAGLSTPDVEPADVESDAEPAADVESMADAVPEDAEVEADAGSGPDDIVPPAGPIAPSPGGHRRAGTGRQGQDALW